MDYDELQATLLGRFMFVMRTMLIIKSQKV